MRLTDDGVLLPDGWPAGVEPAACGRRYVETMVGRRKLLAKLEALDE